MKRIIHTIKKPQWAALIILIIAGLFVRLYKINAFVTFLGDQGRDAIIMRRILTLEHLPAVGAPSSVGQVYLGPFYYYFIAPWLGITGFDPIGPAIGVALISGLGVAAVYYIVQDLFDRRTALLSAVFMTFSAVMVDLSRFSWNPNLLPLFSIIAIYSVIKSVRSGKLYWFVVAGAFISFSIQLHYVALSLGLPIAVLLLWYVKTHSAKLKEAIKNIGAMTAAFLVFTSPLIFFDIRHDFINIRNFIKLFTDSQASSPATFNEILKTFHIFTQYAFSVSIPEIIAAVILIAGLAVYMAHFKKDIMFAIVGFFFLSMLIITSFFTGNKHPHYFGALYPLIYIITAYLIACIKMDKRGFVAGFFVGIFTLLQINHYSFMRGEGSYQIDHAKRVAAKIQNTISSDQFRVTGLPDKYGDSPYRYFLEVWGKRSLEKDTMEMADELFVVCQQECEPIGDAQWDIAYFAATDIEGTWKVDNVTIYKLIRK